MAWSPPTKIWASTMWYEEDPVFRALVRTARADIMADPAGMIARCSREWEKTEWRSLIIKLIKFGIHKLSNQTGALDAGVPPRKRHLPSLARWSPQEAEL
jgi:hypothetical protein